MIHIRENVFFILLFFLLGYFLANASAYFNWHTPKESHFYDIDTKLIISKVTDIPNEIKQKIESVSHATVKTEDDYLNDVINKLNESEREKVIQKKLSQLILEKPDHSQLSYKELLSATGSARKAFKKLSVTNDNEIDVVRSLTLVDMITDAWSLSKEGRRRNDGDVIESIFSEQWNNSADMIIASNCNYCGSHFDFVAQMVKRYGLNPKFSQQMIGIGPRYLKIIDALTPIDAEQKKTLIINFAKLSYLGRNKQYIAEQLLAFGEEALANKVLQGASPASKSLVLFQQLSAAEQDQIIQDWRFQISRGWASDDTTVMLASTGYRPALRWMIWKLDGHSEAITRGNASYKRAFESYLSKRSNFGYLKNEELSAFYSIHWMRIVWQPEKMKWLKV